MSTQAEAETLPYYRNRLQMELLARQRNNPAYSIRAFGKFLGLHQASVSAVLRGERRLPAAHADRIAAKLALSPVEKSQFLLSIQKASSQRKGAQNLRRGAAPIVVPLLEEERHFHIIAQWEYAAILTLAELRVFRPEPEWIGRRLGIPSSRAAFCIETLVAEGLLLRRTDGTLTPSAKTFRTTDGVASLALRQSNREALELGLKKLEEVPYDERENVSLTFPVSKKRLPLLRRMIRRWRCDFLEFAEKGECDEVYQLAIQLYPLTVAEKTAQERNR